MTFQERLQRAWRGPYLPIGLGGAWMALCWLPFGLAPLMPIGAALAILGIRSARTRGEAWKAGLVFGAMRYMVASQFLLSLVSHSWTALFFYPMAIASVLPWAWGETALAWWLDRRFGLDRGIGLCITYALSERLRTIGDTSFPADLLSHAFGDTPAWMSWNPWIGPFVFTLFIFLVGHLLIGALQSFRNRRRRPAAGWLALALLLWLAPPLTDRIGAGGGRTLETIPLAIVQPWVKGDDKLNRERWPALRETLERYSREAADGGAELILWPETARPGPLVWEADATAGDPWAQSLADQLGVTILYGTEIARLDSERHVSALYNGAAIVYPNAPERFGWYGKQHLLPFVEGVPFADLIGFDPARAAREGKRRSLSFLGNFYRGPAPVPFEYRGLRIGVMICYEGMYPSLGRLWRDVDANALVLLTNDAWWGRSTFAPWHARMLSARARELRVPIARAANSGISTIFDTEGRSGIRTPWLSAGVTHYDWQIPVPRAKPFWTKYPDRILFTAMLLMILWGRFRRQD